MGGIEDHQVIERDKNKASLKNYLMYSKHWFQYEFDDDFFDDALLCAKVVIEYHKYLIYNVR